MKRIVIFISGWGVPGFLQRTPLVWDDKSWEDYGRIYLSSKMPASDVMVKKHLQKLNKFVNAFDKPIVVSQSLGAWWAANLACQPDSKIDKLVLMIPLSNLSDYPFFNASPLLYPLNREPLIKGPHKVLVAGARNDIIAPVKDHAERLARHFNATPYELNGGHYFQKDHKAFLQFTKDWIEI